MTVDVNRIKTYNQYSLNHLYTFYMNYKQYCILNVCDQITEAIQLILYLSGLKKKKKGKNGCTSQMSKKIIINFANNFFNPDLLCHFKQRFCTCLVTNEIY